MSHRFALHQHLKAVQVDKEAACYGFALAPSSLYITLGLALNGSGDGSTCQQELYDLLTSTTANTTTATGHAEAPAVAGAGDIEQLTLELAVLVHSLADHAGNNNCCQLVLANAVFSNALPIRPDYSAAMARLLQAKVEETDSTGAINAWAAEATRGRIQQAVSPDMPFKILLTNAVYFKGLWECDFNKSDTLLHQFTLDLEDEGGKVLVPMMYKKFTPSETTSPRVMYKQAVHYSAVRLPYKGTSISAVVVLPHTTSSSTSSGNSRGCSGSGRNSGSSSSSSGSGAGIYAAVAGLDITELLDSSRFSALPAQGLELYLPRFRLQTGCASLKEALMQLGLRSAFDPETADFRRLSSAPAYISDVLQSVYMEVDEGGTQAAAAEAACQQVQWQEESGPPAPCIVFDRPFLFLLVDEATSSLLLSAVIRDPTP